MKMTKRIMSGMLVCTMMYAPMMGMTTVLHAQETAVVHPDTKTLGDAKDTIDNVFRTYVVTNLTTGEDVLKKAQSSIDSRIHITWKENNGFVKVQSTPVMEGAISGTFLMTLNDMSLEVPFQVAIPKTPDNMPKIAEAKTSIQAALNNYVASNQTSAADLMNIAMKATKNGVDVSWKAGNEFMKVQSTPVMGGAVSGTFVLTYDTSSDEVSFQLGIAKTDDVNAKKVNEDKLAVDKALKALKVNNDTTADDILVAAKKAAKNGSTMEWSKNDAFTKVLATTKEKGSIKGTLLLNYNGSTSEVQFVETMEQLTKKPVNWMLIGGIGAAVVVAGSVAGVAIYKRKKQKQAMAARKQMRDASQVDTSKDQQQ